MLRTTAAMLVALGFGLPAAAQDAPPEGSLPLSEVLATLEAGGDVAYIDEVDWDDDGYWEVEYHRADGAEVEVKLDPATGEPRS